MIMLWQKIQTARWSLIFSGNNICKSTDLEGTLLRSCGGIIMIKELSKPVLVYLELNFLFSYQKFYMWHFLIYKLACMIWLSRKYFLYYFLVPIRIKSSLIFLLNHERHYLKIYGVFHFSDIQCDITFLGENEVSLNLYPVTWNLYPGFKLLHTLGRSNFHLPKMTW